MTPRSLEPLDQPESFGVPGQGGVVVVAAVERGQDIGLGLGQLLDKPFCVLRPFDVQPIAVAANLEAEPVGRLGAGRRRFGPWSDIPGGLRGRTVVVEIGLVHDHLALSELDFVLGIEPVTAAV